MRIDTLTEAQRAAEVAVPNDVLRSIICTRIFVRTGINLRDFRPEQDNDPQIVEEMVRSFEELGYPLLKAQKHDQHEDRQRVDDRL